MNEEYQEMKDQYIEMILKLADEIGWECSVLTFQGEITGMTIGEEVPFPGKWIEEDRGQTTQVGTA